MKSKPFSKEQDEWLKKHHYPDVAISIFTSEYNNFWNENRSVDTMKHHCAKLGLKQERRTFTQEQDEWLLERNRKYSLKDTTLAFEYSSVDADINTTIDSVKNPNGGIIRSKGINELILDENIKRMENYYV